MFISEALKTHFETSATVQIKSLILAEWNMNMPDNIYKVGNYRYRPTTPGSVYYNLPNTFDNLDFGNYYTGATDADVVIDNGFKDNNTPQQFTLQKDKMKMLYSLEDCLKPFRPRSGINKPLYFGGRYIANSGENIAQRPRYYMPNKYDEFKYWTSYRTENNIEYGISNQIFNGLNYINDSVPFVVYKENIPANRIIVKMQTNVGSVDLGPFVTESGSINDPLYGDINKTTPSRWKIQYLYNNNWIDAISFNENTTRSDGSPIVGVDGYLEIQYGLIVPQKYENIFIFAGELASETLLPSSSFIGYSYLVINNNGEIGTFYIWTGEEYETFTPTYGWKIGTESINNQSSFVTDFTNPEKFTNPVNGDIVYREFAYIQGIRIVVEAMNKFDVPFDLIEMSPRLIGDISDKVVDYKVTKVLSDLGTTSMPVGQLLASTGQINLFDDDQAFNENNIYNFTTQTGSIISKYVRKNIKFNFYEEILDVDGFDYYIPIKTLYSEGFPQADVTGATLSISLRDFYFYLESTPAPQLLMTQTSLSMAISTILDYIGFTNYTFKRISGESDPIIPYFFVAPDQNIAEVLNQLATSTQTAMFFDEYNNLVIMSKNYLMPDTNSRATDFILSGSTNQTDTGVIENATSGNLPNIISVASEDKKVYNDGKINYTMRYIQRSYGSIRESSMVDRDKTWIYKPVLLWEVAGDGAIKTINQIPSTQGNYVLGAMPLNSDLSSEPPSVVNNKLENNTLDLGENIYWLTRFQGYFYSNGEIIKYDAAQFNVTMAIWYPIQPDGSLLESSPQIVLPGKLAPVSVINSLDKQVLDGQITEAEKNQKIQEWRNSHRQGSSNVWITSNQEYQKYFASLPFNGKIYPTGLIRIFSTPYYETVDGIERLQNGAVYEHGRGQFGTPITTHYAGMNTYWSNNDYVRGCNMQTQYLFTTTLDANLSLPTTSVGEAGLNNTLAKQTTRNSIIKNFMAANYISETDVNNLKSTQTGTIQSSALVMNGPAFKTNENPVNFISYVYKNLNGAYKHFGTRLRVIGKIENNENRSQTPIGSVPYYQVTDVTTEKNVNIGGGSGGVAVLLNPETNNGYYFEIAALSETDIEKYLKRDKTTNEPSVNINNVIFYKIKKSASTSAITNISASSGVVTYTANNSFSEGSKVTITGVNPNSYNLTNVVVKTASPTSFTVDSIATGTYISGGTVSSSDAIPIKLWGGITNITVDDGNFTGQYRMAGEDTTTVYDLAVEYQDIGNTRRFYLYINNKLIKIVDDTDPLPIYNNMALFVRGSSRCMFEHIYALSENYSQNTVFTVGETLSSVFGDKQIDANESFRKYAMSGIIQGTYLTGIGSQQPPKYNMYFDEFGTIMRECAYFDIRYDRAYPALYSQLSPTFNRIKGYAASGFQANSYGAEFLIFNASDKALVLDETTGNYLRIQGIAFTQETTHELTVDNYFNKKSNLSDPPLQGSTLIYSPLVEKAKYDKIKQSRLIYGTNEFSIQTPYIQTQDDAEALMQWIIDKVMVPKKSVGVNIYPIPTLQLGDIVRIDYKNNDGLDLVAPNSERFVIYNIDYTRSNTGPSMTLYLSEV